jgi:hypothetical protein
MSHCDYFAQSKKNGWIQTRQDHGVERNAAGPGVLVQWLKHAPLYPLFYWITNGRCYAFDTQRCLAVKAMKISCEFYY